MRKNDTFLSVRTTGVLTGSYVAGTILEELHPYNQMTLLCDYTQGSLTSVEILVEYSYDGTTYYQDANIATSGGTNTLSTANYTYAGGDANFVIDFPINCNFIRVSVKGTGTATGSDLIIKAIPAFVG